MDIYDLLSQTVTINKYFNLAIDFPNDKKELLETEEEKSKYELIANVCSISMKAELDTVEFSPAFIFEGKRSYSVEDIKGIDYDALNSLEHAKLPINVCARITDILWTQRKLYKFAIIAAESYLNLFNLFFKDDDWVISLKMIKRALCISAQINKADLNEKCCQIVYDHLLRINGNDADFLSVSLIELLLHYSFGDLSKIIGVLNKILDLNKNNPNKMEFAFDLKYKCINKLNGFSSAKAVNLDKADYFRDFAEQTMKNAKTGPIRAEMFFQKAIQLYRNNGEPQKAELVHRRLVEVQKSILSSMMCHEDTIDVSKYVSTVNDLMKNLTFEECVMRIAQLTHFYTKQEGQDNVIKTLQNFPISNMFGKNIVNHDGQTILSLPPLNISNPTENLDVLDLHIHHKLFELESYSGNIFLRFALSFLRENFDIKNHTLDFLFEHNAIVPEGRENIIKKGLELAFEGDYYASIHILAPQAENIFRHIAKEAGALTVTLENDGSSKQKTLSSIFELPELLDCYDNDILFLFKGLLNEQAGANIRNEIAHGITETSNGSSGASIYFICAMIRLLVFSSPIYSHVLTDSSSKQANNNECTTEKVDDEQ